MEKEIDKMGAFPCPHCKKDNLCDCNVCKSHYDKQELGDYRYRITEADGNFMKCAYCGAIFSYDESLEEEYAQVRNKMHDTNEII